MAKSAKIVGPFQIRSEKAKAQSLVELSLAQCFKKLKSFTDY